MALIKIQSYSLLGAIQDNKTVLGGSAGSGGGTGDPPAGFVGQLTQSNVTFDTGGPTRACAAGSSGSSSLVDNLDAIRLGTEICDDAIENRHIAAGTITADKLNMGIGDGLFNAADGLLLFGPHCEINTTEWWSARKQKATLSGAFHQEAGRWMGTRGLVVEEATTNLILNPSIEVATTGWAATSCVISRDTKYSVFGDACLKTVTSNLTGSEGPYDTVTAETAASTEYTFSCYVRGSGTVWPFFYDADGGFQSGTLVTLTSTLTRIETTKTFGTGGTRLVGLRTNVQQDITFYADGFQLEEQDYTTSYADGTLGTGYAWTGAAHGSTSTRTATEVNLDAHVGLINDNNTLSFRVVVQMPYDADDANWPGNFPMLFDTSDGTNNNRITVYYNVAAFKFMLYTNLAGVATSDVQTFVAGDWLEVLATLNYTTDEYFLYINGLEVGSGTNVLAAPTGMTLYKLGTFANGNTPNGFVFAEFAVFDPVLTAIEAAGMYALQRPIVDWGAIEKPSILDNAVMVVSDDVSDPPTDTQLDTAFGKPTTLGEGFMGLVDDAGAQTKMWLAITGGSTWWYEELTKAV